VALVPVLAASCALALAGGLTQFGGPAPVGAVPVAATTPGATAAPPGAPGQPATWAPANKHGFGTSRTAQSRVWYTLGQGGLTEVYYPDLGTPSVRDLQFVVTDGRSFAELERDSTVQRTRLADPRALTYQQINTERAGRWRIVKTYVTDPARASVLVDVRFVSLTGRPYQVYALYDPSLSNNGMDDTGGSAGTALVAADAASASGLVARPAFTATSTGYLGTSDGWTDLRTDFRMDWQFPSAPAGNTVQTGRTALTGTKGHRHLTLSLGFGRDTGAALGTARASLARGFHPVAARYAAGWHAYLSGLKRPPHALRSAATRATYLTSVMVLAAHEDKTYRGAYVASPTMPWVWGTGLENPSGAYHLVWARDLYEIATGLLAAGDRAGAQRALDYLLTRQQRPDGSFPQNSLVDGTPHWGSLQLDEVADPIVLAWQLGRRDAATWGHVKRAADFLLGWHDTEGHAAPYTPQERWENQSGYSPATIAAEIAGLVCAADLARANGDTASASRYLAAADAWQASVKAWTVTSTGPYSTRPYFLRLTKDGRPDAGTTYNIGDSGPDNVDQRRVVDASFLELVRLGVLPANDPAVVNSLAVVDRQLAVSTPNGQFWHRYNFDGYGEQRDGSPWDIGFPPDSQATIGRVWPIFAGERGEYELAAGRPAGTRLAAMAATANDGRLIPEQVWDDNPPSGQPGFRPGTGTFSATPLAWSHAQLIRLAWSIEAGHPVEQPSVVADRYLPGQ
jgi:glucoamylase